MMNGIHKNWIQHALGARSGELPFVRKTSQNLQASQFGLSQILCTHDQRDAKAREAALQRTNIACGKGNSLHVGTRNPAMFRQDVYHDTPDENNGRLHKVENETTYPNPKLKSNGLSNTPQCPKAQSLPRSVPMSGST